MSERPRRAAALNSKYGAVNAAEEERNEVTSNGKRRASASTSSAPPATKKPRKKSVKKLNVPRPLWWYGLLSLFPEQPIDIIVQVLSYLNLRDLFDLLRTSSRFRALLVGDLKGCWAIARRQAGLPLPSGMTELFLPHLLYGNQCFLCNYESNVTRVDGSRTRTCTRCYKAGTIKDLGRAVSRIANVHPEAINLVPQQILSVGSRTNAKRRVFKYFTLDGVIYAVSKSIKMVSEELYAIENAGNICLADSPNVEAGEDGSVGGASATGNTALSTFIAGRKREIAHRHAEMQVLARAVRLDDQAEDRAFLQESRRLDEITNRRRSAMIAKGLNLGYSRYDLYAFGRSVNKSEYYPVVTHSFSEEEWNLTKTDLIARFEASRQEGIEASRIEENWLAKHNRERAKEEERRANIQQWRKHGVSWLEA